MRSFMQSILTFSLLMILLLRPVFSSQDQVRYTYIERPHTLQEDLNHLGALHTLGVGIYYLTQTDNISDHGSWRNYRNNFGKIGFDQDEPIWNFVGHPYTGSQEYLFYRARGYSRLQALKMTFYQSTLFEFTVEVYTEPPSIQDLYQTPILGATLGFLLEHVSLGLLNTGHPFAQVIGHILNPSTIFWFYEGRVQVMPLYKDKSAQGITLYVSF